MSDRSLPVGLFLRAACFGLHEATAPACGEKHVVQDRACIPEIGERRWPARRSGQPAPCLPPGDIFGVHLGVPVWGLINIPPNVPPDKVCCYDTNRDKPGQQGDCNPAKRKGPRCILVHRGPLGHALMVEAGGVEPPSENIPRKASTGLGQEQISPPCSPLTGHRAAIPPVQISWKLPAGAKLHQPDAMSPAGRIRRRPV